MELGIFAVPGRKVTASQLSQNSKSQMAVKQSRTQANFNQAEQTKFKPVAKNSQIGEIQVPGLPRDPDPSHDLFPNPFGSAEGRPAFQASSPMQNESIRDSITNEDVVHNKKNPSKGQNQDLVAGGPSAGATDNNSPLKARFEDGRELPKSFMSTEELLSPLEPEPEKKKASESLLKAFMNSKPESAREQQAQEVISVYRDITLTNSNIKQMLAILF